MKNYKKSEVIGLLLNLGLEPQGLEVRPEFNKDHKLQHNSYLVFALDTESLLNIFPNVNSDFTENREIARKYYKGTNSTVGVQLGTIELNDDVKLYSDMEIFGIVKQIYNGNVMNGNLLVFKNKEVDKYMDKYRESIKHVVNPYSGPINIPVNTEEKIVRESAVKPKGMEKAFTATFSAANTPM